MPEPAPLSEGVRPAPWRERLEQMLIVLDERERQARLEDLKRSLEADRSTRRPGRLSCHRIGISTALDQRPDTKNLKRPDPSSRASGRILDGQVG